MDLNSKVIKIISCVILFTFCFTQAGLAAPAYNNYGRNLRGPQPAEQARAAGNLIEWRDVLEPVASLAQPPANLDDAVLSFGGLVNSYLERRARGTSESMPDNFIPNNLIDMVVDIIEFARRTPQTLNSGLRNSIPKASEIRLVLETLKRNAPKLARTNCSSFVLDSLFADPQFSMPEVFQPPHFNNFELFLALAIVFDIITTGHINFMEFSDNNGNHQILRNSLLGTIATIRAIPGQDGIKDWVGVTMTAEDVKAALKEGKTVLAALGESHLVSVQSYKKDIDEIEYLDISTKEENDGIQETPVVKTMPAKDFFEMWKTKPDGAKSKQMIAVTDWQPKEKNKILTVDELIRVKVGCGIMSYFGWGSGIGPVLGAAGLLAYRAPDSTGMGFSVGPRGLIAIRRALGKPVALAGLVYEDPFNATPVYRDDDEVKVLRAQLLKDEGLLKAYASLPAEDEVGCSIEDLYSSESGYVIRKGNYGRYAATKTYTIDRDFTVVNDITADYGISIDMVKYFMRQVLSAKLDTGLVVDGFSDKADPARKKLALGAFDAIIDRKLAGKPLNENDKQAWAEIEILLEGLKIEIPADFDLDPVRYAFRALAANVVSQFNVNPELENEVQEIFNEKTRDTGLEGENWYDTWVREYELNIAGLAFESLVEFFQHNMIIPRSALSVSSEGFGVLDSLAINFLPITVNGHGRWGMCGGITVSNAHPHLDPRNVRMLELNGSLRMDTYSTLREQQNQWFMKKLSDEERNIIWEYNAAMWVADEIKAGRVKSEDAEAKKAGYIEQQRSAGELHRSENDTEVLVYEWAMIYDQIMDPEFVDMDPLVRASLSKLREDGITNPDEQALRLALIRTRDGSEMGVDTFSIYNPRVKYVASHNRPVTIVEHNGKIMVSSDQNAALGLWPPEEIKEALADIAKIRENQKESLAKLETRHVEKDIGDADYKSQRETIAAIAKDEEGRILSRFKANVIYLEGEGKFARISEEMDEAGKVKPVVVVTNFEGKTLETGWNEVTINPAQIGKGDDPTFMLHHIKEIPGILKMNADNYFDRDGNVNLAGLNVSNLKAKFGQNLGGLKRVFLVGVGSSYRDGKAAQECFEALLPGVEILVYDPAELLNKGIKVNPETDLCVAIAWSGSTASTIRAVNEMQNKDVMCCAVTGKIQSDLARMTVNNGGSVDVQSGIEVSVCTVKGFESILYTLDLLAAQLSQEMKIGDVNEKLKQVKLELRDAIPDIVKVEMESEVHNAIINEIAEKYANRSKMIVVGSSAVVEEAELKFEEVLWIVGVSFDLSDTSYQGILKLTRQNPEDTPVVLVNATDESRLQEAIDLIKKLHKEGVEVVAQTYEGDHVDELKSFGIRNIYITTKVAPVLQDIADAPFYFRLVHEMAMQKGMTANEIDNCRNLAKSVTVTGAQSQDSILKEAGTMRALGVDEFIERHSLPVVAGAAGLPVLLQQVINFFLTAQDDAIKLSNVREVYLNEFFGNKFTELKEIVIVADDEASYNAAIAASNVFHTLLGIEVTIIRSAHRDFSAKIRDKTKTLVITIDTDKNGFSRPKILDSLKEQVIAHIALTHAGTNSTISSLDSGGAVLLPEDLNDSNAYPVVMLELMALGLRIAQLKGLDVNNYVQGIRRIPAVASFVINDQNLGKAISGSMLFAGSYDKAHMIGGGSAYASARQCATDFNSGGILFSEGQMNDSAWHGPLAAVDPDLSKFGDPVNKTGVNSAFDTKGDTLIFMFITDSGFYSSSLLDAQVYNTRNARIILIVQDGYQDLPVIKNAGASAILVVPRLPDYLTPFANFVLGNRFADVYKKAAQGKMTANSIGAWKEAEDYRPVKFGEKPAKYGTDGIRGIYSSENIISNEFITPVIAYRMGLAAALQSLRNGKNCANITMDPRPSSKLLLNALVRGIQEMGVEAVIVGEEGVSTTPLTQWVTLNNKEAGAGAVISGSHLSAGKNGIKLLGEKGEKISREVESITAEIVNSTDLAGTLLTLAGNHGIKLEDRMKYLPAGQTSMVFNTAVVEAHVKETVSATIDAVRVVNEISSTSSSSIPGCILDLANGAAAAVMSGIISEIAGEMHTQIIAVNEGPGSDINKECGAEFMDKQTKRPIVLPEKVEQVYQSGRLIVFFDGDADRVIFAIKDPKTNEVIRLDGDFIASIEATIVRDLLEKLGLDDILKIGGAQTAYSNLEARHYQEKLGVVFGDGKEGTGYVETGDKYVRENLDTRIAIGDIHIGLGFEPAGHGFLIFGETAKDTIRSLKVDASDLKKQADKKLLLAIIALQNEAGGDGIRHWLTVYIAMEYLMRAQSDRFSTLSDFNSEIFYITPEKIHLKTKVTNPKAIKTVGNIGTELIGPAALAENVKTILTQYGPDYRIVIRASGTEPVVRIYAEGPRLIITKSLASKLKTTTMSDPIVNRHSVTADADGGGTVSRSDAKEAALVIGPDDTIRTEMITKLNESGVYATVITATDETDAARQLEEIEEQYTVGLVVDCSGLDVDIAGKIRNMFGNVEIPSLKTRDPEEVKVYLQSV